MENSKGEQIVIGCNYHTTWQRDRRMRFILVETKGDRARLKTRVSKADFWTNIDDLIFIKSNYNKDKAKRLNQTT